MVNRGHTANAAIDSIYQVYGLKESVTYILKKISSRQENKSQAVPLEGFMPLGFPSNLRNSKLSNFL